MYQSKHILTNFWSFKWPKARSDVLRSDVLTTWPDFCQFRGTEQSHKELTDGNHSYQTTPLAFCSNFDMYWKRKQILVDS